MSLIHKLLVACTLVASGSLWAQCGVTMTCTGTPPGIPGVGLSGVCRPGACLKDDKAREDYAKKHDCTFPPGDTCGEKPINTSLQCCTKDAQSGKAKIKSKQITVLDGEFNWDNYKKECTGMRQSEAPPDGLWAKCEVDKKHSETDDWVVKEVVKNPIGPEARTFCVDGCSTPPGAITAAFKLNIFLVKDKDNPTGHANSSFYSGCKSHDICYQTCSTTSQLTCDTNLREQSLAACELIPPDTTTTITTLGITSTVNTRFKCRDAAREMFKILSTLGFGAKAFNLRRQQMCQCC